MFPQSPKSTKIYSSKYKGYRFVIDIAQNIEHAQNKNFNFDTRYIQFTDKNCVISRSGKIARKNR